jgi:hypothetical protein
MLPPLTRIWGWREIKNRKCAADVRWRPARQNGTCQKTQAVFVRSRAIGHGWKTCVRERRTRMDR